MKTRFLTIFAIGIIGSVGIVFGEPVPYEEFIKIYQPKLDRVQDEDLPPIKQSKIGIHFNDIFCHYS